MVSQVFSPNILLRVRIFVCDNEDEEWMQRRRISKRGSKFNLIWNIKNKLSRLSPSEELTSANSASTKKEARFPMGQFTEFTVWYKANSEITVRGEKWHPIPPPLHIIESGVGHCMLPKQPRKEENPSKNQKIGWRICSKKHRWKIFIAQRELKS